MRTRPRCRRRVSRHVPPRCLRGGAREAPCNWPNRDAPGAHRAAARLPCRKPPAALHIPLRSAASACSANSRDCCRHSCHRLTDEAHDVGGEYRPIRNGCSEACRRDIRRRDDGAHARHGLRLAGIQPHDAGVGKGTPQDLSMEHAGQREVGGVSVRAGHLADTVEPGHALAGNVALRRGRRTRLQGRRGVVCVHSRCHAVGPAAVATFAAALPSCAFGNISPAAAATASTIF